MRSFLSGFQRKVIFKVRPSLCGEMSSDLGYTFVFFIAGDVTEDWEKGFM